MDTNTFSPKVAAATLAPAGRRNRSAAPERMAVIKGWDAMIRGARQYCAGSVTIQHMPHLVGVTGACETTDALFNLDWYGGKRMSLPQPDQLYSEMLTCVPFLLNRDNLS